VSQSIIRDNHQIVTPIADMDDIFDVDAADRNPDDEYLEMKAVRDG